MLAATAIARRETDRVRRIWNLPKVQTAENRPLLWRPLLIGIDHMRGAPPSAIRVSWLLGAGDWAPGDTGDREPATFRQRLHSGTVCPQPATHLGGSMSIYGDPDELDRIATQIEQR